MEVGDRVITPLGKGILIKNEILEYGYNRRWYVKVENIKYIKYGMEHKGLTESLIKMQNENGFLAFHENEITLEKIPFDPAVNDSIKDMEEEEKAFPSDKE